MPEIMKKVETFIHQYFCDQCQKGIMKFTGNSYFSNEPKREHKCENCGNLETFNRMYPYPSYKESVE